jgi:hypothetical protein
MKDVVASLLLLVVVGACAPSAATSPSGAPASTPAASAPSVAATETPKPTAADGAEALVADLIAAGNVAKLGSNFLADPLRGEGRLVCVGKEAVQVYVQKDHEAALAVASTIDKRDPTRVGTSIVTWNGTPRFWLRDRIIVLYVGADAATDSALRTLLGQPFAESHEPGFQPLPSPECA